MSLHIYDKEEMIALLLPDLHLPDEIIVEKPIRDESNIMKLIVSELLLIDPHNP